MFVGRSRTGAVRGQWATSIVTVSIAAGLLLSLAGGRAAAADRDDVLDRYGRLAGGPSGRVNYVVDIAGVDPAAAAKGGARVVIDPNEPSEPPETETEGAVPAGRSGPLALSIQEEWRTGVFGSGIGSSGLVTRDVDGDGQLEILAGGTTSTFGPDNYWYVLRYDVPSASYVMEWLSAPVPEGITRIAAFNADGVGHDEIYLGLESGELRILDGVTRGMLDTVTTAGGAVNQVDFGDVDNDGALEIVVCGESRVSILNAVSHEIEQTLPYGTSDCKVGNVDGDPAQELVLASGVVLEVHGLAHAVQWDYPGGDFGWRIEVADIDGDGMEEVVGASSWYSIIAFDIDLESPKWQIPTDLDVDALLLADVTGDGVPEVLYGDGQWGSIYCHDARTRALLWSIPNPEHGVTNIAVADTDGDRGLEVLWGAGASSTGEDHLYVHSVADQSFEWTNEHIDGPFNAVTTGDVDGDGVIDIVTASFSSESGYADGIVQVYNGKTHVLEWSTTPGTFGRNAWTGLHALAIGDPDGDGQNEVLVGTDRLYDGAIYVLSGSTGAVEASYFYDDGAPIYSLTIADVDGDGAKEIVAGGGRAHTGAPGVYVYVIDGATGAVEWKSVSLGAYWSEISRVEVAQVDGDPALEIVALNDWLFIIDGVTHVQWQSSDQGFRSLAIAQVTGDSRPEVVAGRSDGTVRAYDGSSHAVVLDVSVGASSIDGLLAFDVDGVDGVDLVFATQGRVGAFGLTARTLLWESEFLGSAAGQWNGLARADVDADRRNEILVGSNYLVYQFQGPQLPGCGGVAQTSGLAEGAGAIQCLVWAGSLVLARRARASRATAALRCCRGESDSFRPR